jgi:riboflavin synthase
MFTGIVNSVGIIESIEKQGDTRIKIACDFKTDSMKPGDSVAVNGVCLTVTAKGFLASGKTYFTADMSQETLNCTVSSSWEKGRKTNLERALKIGDALGGHLVTGHVDGIATIKDITVSGDSYILSIEAPAALSRFIAEKGSVCLDGVSLTVNKVENQLFSVNIIPHTWQNTTLGERKPGDSLNLEIDLIARYAARLLQK